MMIFRVGRYLINMAAILAVRFHSVTLSVTNDGTEVKKSEVCTVYMQGGTEFNLDEAETVDLNGAFAELGRLMAQQAQHIAVPVPPNIRRAN